MNLIYEAESYALRKAFFEVYATLGCGFLESVYQEALAMEFHLQKIPFQEQICLQMQYKGRLMQQTFKPDFLCYGKVIVEIKAVSELIPDFEAQVMNYMRITGMRLGFLVNFGHYPRLELKRFVL